MVAAAGSCGGVLLYHIAARIAVTVFMVGAVKTLKPSADERARKKKETASRHAAAFTRAQLARARTLMAKQGTREGERRDAGAQPSQSSAGPRATHAGWTREKPAPAHLRPASGPLTAVDARTPQHRTARPSADLDDGAAPRCSARRLDLDAGEHVGREQRASPRSLSALDQRTGERTAHHGLADAAHAHYTARLDLGRRPVAEKPAWLRAMELDRSSGLWCSRIDILLGARGPVPGRGLLPVVLLPIMAGYRKLSGDEAG